ncbi:MAG TPA: hypothetical protein VIF62_03780, partial [Labilithrix sp.]
MRVPVVAMALWLIVACGGSKPSAAAPLVPEENDEPDAGADAADDPPPPMSTVSGDTPERSRAPSTATYDEALAKPEPVDVGDDAPHLTDAQLTSPMNGALVGCRLLPN